MSQPGMPAEILLLFTVLIWALYFLIYLSSPENKVNQWACICGFLLIYGIEYAGRRIAAKKSQQ